MPKVTGPLFSVSATGRLAGVLDYVNKTGQAIVRQARRFTPPVGPVTAGQNAAVTAMIDCWNSQTQVYRDEWKARGPVFGLSGYQLFWRQWFLQGSDCQNLPILP